MQERGMNGSDALQDKVALVTGAARGIGYASAKLMAERGAEVALLDINEEGVAKAAAELRAAGHKVSGYAADVADKGAVKRALGVIAGRIDILVNNAGISGQEAAFANVDEDRFGRMMDIHVKGAFFLTQLVLPGMAERKFGRIINMSSNRGMVGYRRSSHYCAAKAALIGLTKAWAKEFAPDGILVNAIAPGVVFSEMNLWNGLAPLENEASLNLLKRWADPVEIAYLVAYLASAEGAFVTGQVISPNGGDPIT
jgi:NAD(P)-dependent dehydrogenase (short-subunit alcohol dehydrogenase family)